MSDKPVIPMCDHLYKGVPVNKNCDRPAKRYKDEEGNDIFLCNDHARARMAQGEVLMPTARGAGNV